MWFQKSSGPIPRKYSLVQIHAFFDVFIVMIEAVVQRCSLKKVFLEISQN